jgi:hypothetical protein
MSAALVLHDPRILGEIASFLPNGSLLPALLCCRAVGAVLRRVRPWGPGPLQSRETCFVSSVPLAQWALRMGCPGLALCNAAARWGHLDVLMWLREENDPPYPWDDYIGDFAARGGHIEVLEWLRGKTHPWDERTSRWAASRGHLHVLRWLREENDPPCPWNEHTCADAARNGHLIILQWLRRGSSPCPWDALTCASAALGGHLHVLKWLREEGCPPCPWDATACEFYTSKNIS